MHRGDKGGLFIANGFGKWLLERRNVIERVEKARAEQLIDEPAGSTSVYLSGCRGMGKTCTLALLARHFSSQGWEVFWFSTASAIPMDIGGVFEKHAQESPNKNIAVIVDEVAANPNAALFNALLKGNFPNVLVLGAAVPRFMPTGSTSTFRECFRFGDLVLRSHDVDVQGLVEHWQALVSADGIDKDVVRDVCNYIISYCGGHVYPVLAFMEHFFTTDEGKKVLSGGRDTFVVYFRSAGFYQSRLFRKVCTRCFSYEMTVDAESKRSFFRMLSGQGDSTDFTTVARLGWWDPDKNNVVSALLLNECLAWVGANEETGVGKRDKRVDGTESSQEKLKALVIEGLSRMQPCDFESHSKKWRIENALSFNWATRAWSAYRNLHLSYQEPQGGTWVDFFVNGSINGAVEVLRDATQRQSPSAKPGSQDIDEHLERFTSGQYAIENFVLLNFAMTYRRGGLVLPKDAAHHDQVFTYVHSENALYCGSKFITAPAVHSMSCPGTPPAPQVSPPAGNRPTPTGSAPSPAAFGKGNSLGLFGTRKKGQLVGRSINMLRRLW